MSDYWEGRGLPWEFDPGPPRNRSWARLFAETPNYRALGKAAMGSEKFRWHYGPMFYRGRLGDGQARVLVIGQEGAQDESLAHRSFIGGTGSRMQHFLKHLGINRSYLFLNTFVYPIFGQYEDAIRDLAQDPASPVVEHRHAIFDYALERNDLHLVVAVGKAAKETVVTWVESHGGSCPDGARDLSTCESHVLGPKTRCLGVLHPGGAAQGGQLSRIVNDFKRAFRKAEEWAQQDPDWLPVDPGAERQPAADYEYRSAPIPFRDVPLGTPWRLGRGGTSSNRRDGQRSIQIFSAGGRYNGSAGYGSSMPGSDEGYEQAPEDRAYEPPRRDYADYDSGPSSSWARLLMGGRPGFEWPDFAALGVTSHSSFGYGPIYRGRTDSAKALVLADQRSHDDLFWCRALTGSPGQHLQALLEAVGLTQSYLIVRVLPVDTLDLSQSKRDTIVDDPQVRAVYGEICRQAVADNSLRFALAVGASAQRLAPHVVPGNLPLVQMPAFGLPGWRDAWLAAQTQIQGLSYAKDVTATYAWDGERRQIPRRDLPYGTLRWQASSGDRAQRGKVDGDWSPNYYKVTMPRWAADLKVEPL